MVKNAVLLFQPRMFHQENYRYFHVPYSLLSVAATVDRDRYEVIVIDNNVVRDDLSSEIRRLRGRLACVGISTMIGRQITDEIAFAKNVRAIDEDVPLVWGGALPTLLPDLTIAHEFVDVIVRGQGQETFPELVAALASGGNLCDILGISYKIGNQIFHNPDRPFSDVNRFPAFATVYDLINPPDYVCFDEHIDTRTISYHSSQGCPFNCGFCSETALWKNRWSGLSVDRILGDIEHLIRSCGINGVKFFDAEFFVDRNRALEFAGGVVDRGLAIRWGAAAHPRSLDRLSEDQLALLRESGASRFLIGAESGVEEELQLIGKRTGREMLLRLAERCSRHDIVASFSFVTGYPGRPAGNIQATLDYAAELASVDPRHEVKVHFFAPYPGTPLYPLALKFGFVPPASLEQWAAYNYYGVTTPWVDRAWEPIVRAFNERHYPYLSPAPAAAVEQPVKAYPLLQLHVTHGTYTREVAHIQIPQVRIEANFKCGKACICCRPTGEGVPVRELERVADGPAREMTVDQIAAVAAILARHSVTDFKLTGGEPMLRTDIVELVGRLKAVPGIASLHMVTRHHRAGELAGALKEAGLGLLNFSLDSLDGATWTKITGVSGHERLVEAIQKAARTGIPIKLSTVVLKGINDREIPALIEFAGELRTELKLLDLINDIGSLPGFNREFADRYYADLIPVAEWLATWAKSAEVVTQAGGLGHPMPRFRMPNGATVTVKSARLGAYYGPVCHGCPFFPCWDALMALRVTPNGMLQYCLLRGDNLTDLLGLLENSSTREADFAVAETLQVYQTANFFTGDVLERMREKAQTRPLLQRSLQAIARG